MFRSRRPLLPVTLSTWQGDTVVTTSVRGRVRAAVAARRMLAPKAVHTTYACYGEDRMRAHAVTVVLPGGSVDVYEPPIVVGRSVAEAGVW
jgi:hypothetical protein